MKKIAVILSLLLLTACSSDSVPDTPPPDAEPANAETQEVTMEIAETNMETSIRLFDRISEDRVNSMFSPLSLNMAFGLLEAGAEGGTRKALDRYLGTESYAELARSYMEKAETYTKNNNGEEYRDLFEIANSLWADSTLPVKPEYADAVSEKFGAEIRNLELGNKEEALKAVNDWVNEKTHELIPRALSDYDEEKAAAILVNTVYFESGWLINWDFYEDITRKFTLPDGSTKSIPLMKNDLCSLYYENEKATAFGEDYRNGMRFIGILPKNEGDFTLEELDIPSLLKSESNMYDVKAQMPRLDFETDIPLTDLLKSAGMGDIFDEDKADFSGISENFYVSDILQKTKLELDEYGTRAAAVTVDIAVAAAARQQKNVCLDRHFAFLIYDAEEEQIVFIGKVTEP